MTTSHLRQNQGRTMNTKHPNAIAVALLANGTAARGEPKRKISSKTLHLFTSIFLCSLVLIADQFIRLGRLSSQIDSKDDDYTNNVPEVTRVDKPNRKAQKPNKLGWSLPDEGAKLSSEEFMKSLQKRRLQSKSHVNTTDKSPHRLQTPIFVLNLPKSGTETSRDYFSCGGYESSHTYVGQRRIGTCFYENMLKDHSVHNAGVGVQPSKKRVPPLTGCNSLTKKFYIAKTDPRYGKNVTVEVYSDIGTPNPTCYYPTLHNGGLDYLYRHYPNATWVVFVRNGEDWYDSMKRWYNGNLLKQWKNSCGFPGTNAATEADWTSFYSRHTEKIRRFVLNRPSLNYIEVELENAHKTLSKYTGIESKCWRHCLPGRQDDDKCVEIGEKHSEKKTSKAQKNQKSKPLAGALNATQTKMDNSPPLNWTLPRVPTVRKNASEFMDELAALKHKRGMSLPWEETPEVNGLKLPTPIFILNLPKSGTQTLTEYFKCGQVESSHTYVRLTRTGDCLRDNYLADVKSTGANGVNPLRGCDEITKKYHVPRNHPLYNQNVTVESYSDIGTPYPGRCFYSSINDGGLEHLYKFYPNATIMLLTREVNSWYTSINNWNDGRLLQAWRFRCGFHGRPNDNSKEDWVDFYHAHTEKIRNFAKRHLSITYVEMELEEASMIDFYTGVPAKCFRHCLPGKKHHEMCKPVGSNYTSQVNVDDDESDKNDLKDGNTDESKSLHNKVVKKNKVQVDNSPPLPWSLPNIPAIQKTSDDFMEELATLKRSEHITLPWEEFKDEKGLKLPTPIFILNLPKSGTQTLTEFFKCADMPSSHTYVKLTRTGDCLRDNYLADLNSTDGVDPLRGCDEIERIYHTPISHPDFGKTVSVLTYSDIGTPFPGRCFYSSINDGGLEHLHKYYPNATIMLLTREVNSWYTSMLNWNRGSLLKKWKSRCGYHGAIGDHSRSDWISFYRAHTEKVRNFAKKHLSMTYVEMELEDASSMIEYYTGIDQECFQHCLPGKKAEEACKPIASSKVDRAI